MKSYITVILISSFLFAALFFALPKTETLFFFNKENQLHLNKKEDKYWKKEFIVELSIEPKDRTFKNEKIENTKNIIYKRLKKIGVEEVQIVNHKYEQEEEAHQFAPPRGEGEEEKNYIKEYIKVTVQTSKDENSTQRLIGSKGDIVIMTPKPALEELSKADQLQSYLPENYDKTKWDRSQFRNILIRNLRASDGERNYFAIFKLKYQNKKEFTDFLNENQGKNIGILKDSLVIPLEVRPELINLFTIAISQDKSEAYIQDILLNTGQIPAEEITIVSTSNLTPNTYDINHIQVILAIFISIISLLLFIYQRDKNEKEKILQISFSLLMIFSVSLTVLKIWQIPVDLFILILTGFLTMIFVKTMYMCPDESRIILIMFVLVAGLMLILGTGYVPILGQFLLFTILLSFITEILAKIYFDNLKIIWNF